VGELKEQTEWLSAEAMWDLTNISDTAIVDLRDPSDFALSHPRGSLNVPYSEKGLEERLSLLLVPGYSIALLTNSLEQANAASLQLSQGVYPVAGLNYEPMVTWKNSSVPLSSLNEIAVSELATRELGEDSVILDVREPIEWDMGYVPHSMLLSLGSLREHLDQVPQNANIFVICEAGIRSSSAASMLQAHGYNHVFNVPEGTAGYRNAGLPLEIPCV